MDETYTVTFIDINGGDSTFENVPKANMQWALKLWERPMKDTVIHIDKSFSPDVQPGADIRVKANFIVGFNIILEEKDEVG